MVRPHNGVVILVLSIVPATLSAAQLTVTLDPVKTEVHWTLGGNLHTVHGTFKLKRGSMHLDDESGQATGEIIVDVASGESGNGTRDRRMQKEILESPKFPEAVFTPDHVEGRLPAQGDGQLSVHGAFRIHGASHEITLKMQVHRTGKDVTATTQIGVPYVAWGMKNPSNFLFKVDDHVEMSITAAASVED